MPKLTKNHYENFPVASILIPKDYREEILLVYWFARTADDIADEGDLTSEQRLEYLANFEREFLQSLKSTSENHYFNSLSYAIRKRNLNIQNFLNLISAFNQDVIKNRYNNYNELLDYCSRSANPVGRIMLELFGIKNEKAILFSDKICTALQLTNFYQDTKIDFQKGRIYYPLDEMNKYMVTEKMFELNQNNYNIKALIKHNVDRAELLFVEGKELLDYLNGRFKYEIKWTISGGQKILSKIRKCDYNVFYKRPKLTKIDFLTLFIKTFI